MLCMFCLQGSMVLPVTAHPKRPLTIVGLMNVPSLSEPQVPPDGSQILYVRSESSWEANKRIGHIWYIAPADEKKTGGR